MISNALSSRWNGSGAKSNRRYTWWRHQMETFSALLAICAGNSPASGEFPAQRPVTRSFDVFFDLCLNKRLRKQSRGWWFETLSGPLLRHCNDLFCCRYRVVSTPLAENGDTFADDNFKCNLVKQNWLNPIIITEVSSFKCNRWQVIFRLDNGLALNRQFII